MFAKLFEVDGKQVLVKIDESEECKPEVRTYCKPDGMGVCSAASMWSDTDEGWDVAHEHFVAYGQEHAEKFARPLFAMAIHGGADGRGD